MRGIIATIVVLGLLIGFAAFLYLSRVTASCPEGQRLTLAKPYPLNGGFAYVANAPGLEKISDSENQPKGSPLMVCESGRALGPAHALHSEVRQLGKGRFSHWGNYIVF